MTAAGNASATSAFDAAAETASAASPPAAERITPSVSAWRISRPPEAPSAASEQKVGEVCRGDQQHQRRRAEQQVERARVVVTQELDAAGSRDDDHVLPRDLASVLRLDE
jgi:hypothetical protein